MADSKELRIVISADGKVAVKALDDTAAATGRLSSAAKSGTEAVDGLGNGWKAAATGLNQAVEVIGKATSKIRDVFNFARELAGIEEARMAFSAYARSIGVDSEMLVVGLKKATRGLVSEADLMRSAMRAMQMGVATDLQTLAKLFSIADMKGDQFGKSMTDVFDTMVDAIGRGQGRLLVELGLLPEKFAKASDSAGLLANRVALTKTVLEQGGKQLADFGDYGDTTADKFDRFNASIEDLKLALLGLQPEVATFVDSMTGIVRESSGVVKWLVSMKGEISAVAAAYASMRIMEVALQLGSLATAANAAALAQQALNLAVSANPYVVAAAAAGYFGKQLYDLQQETIAAEEIERRQVEALRDIGVVGPKAYNELRIAALNAQMAELGNLEALETRLGALKQRVSEMAMRRESRPENYREGQGESIVFMAGADAIGAEAQELRSRIAQIKALRQELEQRTSNVPGLNALATRQSSDAKRTMDALAAAMMGAGSQLKKVSEGHAASGAAAIKHADAAKEVIERYESLATVSERAFASALKFARMEPLEQVRSVLIGNTAAAIELMDALGLNKIDAVRDGVESLATQAGLLAGNLERGAADFREMAMTAKGIDVGDPAMTAMAVSGGFGIVPTGTTQGPIDDSGIMQAEANFAREFRVDIADAFEQGLYDGLDGGNFLKSFGQALRSQVARSLAASITQGLFQGGGSFSLGSAGAGGAAQQAASGGGGTGGIGGLLNFGPVMRDGTVQTGNLGQYAAAGLVINKLFGEGGVFGSRVVHGSESFGSANEVNSRVSEAAANRDRLYQTVIGVSAATLQQLRELQFASARVVESRSGDGIFSKKTTTYSLDATAANESLEQFAKLQAKVAGEAAAHALDLATANLNDPFTAMEMTIRDLRDLIAKQTDPAEAAGSRANLLTAMRDQERQRWSRSSSLLEAMAASPFSGITSRSAFGSSIETMPMGARQYAMGMFPNLPVTSTGSASFGAVESLLDMNDLMRGINAQNSYDSRMRGAISSGEDSQVTALLTERKAALEAQITALGEVASTLATDIPLSSSIEEATAKFQQWQIAVQGLANASNEVAQIDAQFAADEANRAADAVRRAEEDRQNAAEARAGWTGALLGSAGMWDRTNILVEPPGGLATSVNLARLGRMRMSGKTPVLATASEIFGNATDATQRLDTFAQAILGQTGIEQQARFAQDSIGADPTKLRRIGDNRIGFMRDAVADLQELIDESYGIMLDRTVSLDDQRRAADTYLSALREQAATETEIAQAQWERTEQNESIIREYQSGWFNTLLGNASGALAFNARLTTPMGDSAIQQLAQGTPLSAQNVSNINETDDERAARILNDQILTIRQNHDIGKYQLEKDFAMESMRLAAQGDDKLMAEYVEARQAQLEEESDLFKAMMDDASERLAQAQGDIDKARAAAADYSAAQQAYVSAELEQLQLEAENKEKLKRAQESLTADLVGTFLTRIGEQKTLESGQQVIVLSAGQPDGKQLAQQIRDSVAGADPTLAEALTLFINSVPDTRWSV